VGSWNPPRHLIKIMRRRHLSRVNHSTHFNCGSLDSPATTVPVATLWAVQLAIRGSICCRSRYLSLHSVQTDPGAHPESYPVGSRELGPVYTRPVKRQGKWTSNLLQVNCPVCPLTFRNFEARQVTWQAARQGKWIEDSSIFEAACPASYLLTCLASLLASCKSALTASGVER
jgi:hypothetical protein